MQLISLTVRLIALASLLLPLLAAAAILPEDRADFLYHSYDGGGVTIDGPSILVRKQAGLNTSLTANYYVDMVTSASIDVVTTASKYTEERTETSIGADYLNDKTILSVNYTNSDESDYTAKSLHLGINQEFFGALSTLTIGYSVGDDEVRQRGNTTFKEEVQRQQYRIGWSQILTKNWIVSGNLETVTDEGFLNNPYRQYRHLDAAAASGYSFKSEVYPGTRTSTAVSLNSLYYLQHRAAIKNHYRFYQDDWEIEGHTFEVGYIRPLGNGWEYDLHYRYYEQTKADFYSDLFAAEGVQNFLARDKELSTFSSHTIGVGLTYDILENGWGFIDRGSVNFYWDHITFEYEDFRDLRTSVDAANPSLAGNEPLYTLETDVIRLFLSIWY